MGYASSSRRQASVNKSQDLALGSDGPTVQTDGDGAAARTPALSLLRSLGSVVRKMSGGGGRRREGEGSEAASSSGRLDYPVDESRTAQAAAGAFASAPAATKSVELVRTPMGLGLTVDSQYKVLAIAKDGQAKRSGNIAVGDQLVSINDVPLSGGGSFEEQLGAIAVGTKVRLVIMDEAADEDYSSNYPAAAVAAKKSAATSPSRSIRRARSRTMPSASDAAVAKKASSEQAAVNELFAGRQVTVWLTESCEINVSDAKLYADALAQLGVDRPADLQMIDGDEVVWPSAVKLLDREKIQARLETEIDKKIDKLHGVLVL